MERKIIFLDIDGVLQPVSSQERFKYCNDDIEQSSMPELYRQLKREFGIDYSIYNQYDVAAVYYDWDKTSVSLLKLILNITDAKIVLSSSWRNGGFDRMRDFFTIYELEKFLIDMTDTNLDKTYYDDVKDKYQKEKGAFIDYRTIEIFEWLQRNPDVKKWAAIDDMLLYSIGLEHFVKSVSSLNEESAERCIRILTTGILPENLEKMRGI